MTIALTARGNRAAPGWMVALTLVVSILVVFCAPAGWHLGETRGIWSLATDPRCLSIFVLIGLTSFLAVFGLNSNPDYRSPYDGWDPSFASCLRPAHTIPGQGRNTVRDPAGRPVGRIPCPCRSCHLGSQE
jgi:hypothetical protein